MSVRQGDVSWSRRYKANLERLSSGDRDRVADVVRELSLLDREHGLSAGERRMLRRAWQTIEGLPGNGGESGVREPRRPLPPTDLGAAAISLPGECARS